MSNRFIYPKLYIRRRLRSQAQSGDKHEETFRSPMSSYLTASMIRYDANNVMPSTERKSRISIYRRGEGDSKRKEGKKERERKGTTVPHECTQSRSRRSVPRSDPSVLRSPVRASLAMLRSDKHPPLDPSTALRRPSVPLSKPTERSLTRAGSSCTASSSASRRPHRARRGEARHNAAIVNAKIERERENGSSSSPLVFVPPHTIAPRLTLRSPLCTPPPPTRVRFLLLLSSTASFISSFSSTAQPRDTLRIRPPAATAILAFAVLVAPLSPKDPRVVP